MIRRGPMTDEETMAGCEDCGRTYGDEHGFPDLIITFDAWRQISGKDDGGLLCPSCICKRLHAAGIRCEGAFMSGPIVSVSGPTMNVLRRVENIELAIDGRKNRWTGVRDLLSGIGEEDGKVVSEGSAAEAEQSVGQSAQETGAEA